MKKFALLALGITLTTAAITTNVFAENAPATAAVTPAEISTLATVAAIDQNEILLGTIAMHKHAPKSVEQLAEMMITQHGANLTDIMQMANQLHALPLTSAMADQFLTGIQTNMVTLGALNGMQFDKAYANAMVTGHEGALKLIDTQLMQTATNPEIKKFMDATKMTVEMHLAAAKKVQAELK